MYYLNPNQGGPEGAMISNCWLTISGKTYFINQSGVMMEGWYQVSGKWYYFYPGDGSKAVSTSIGGFCCRCRWCLGTIKIKKK